MNTRIPTRTAIWLLMPALIGTTIALGVLTTTAPLAALALAAALSVPLWIGYARMGGQR